MYVIHPCILFFLFLMRKRKYSFRLIQIRFVTSKASNSVGQYSHKHMSMLICVFRQLALAKTDSQTKKRKEKTKSIQAAHANQTFSSHYIDRHLFLEKRKKKCRHKHIRSIIARQISVYADDWVKSSGFTFHITCEKMKFKICIIN